MVSERKIKNYVPLELRFSHQANPDLFYNPLERKWYDQKDEKENEFYEDIIFNTSPDLIDPNEFQVNQIKLKQGSNGLYASRDMGDTPLPTKFQSKMYEYFIESIESEITAHNRQVNGMHNLEKMHKLAVSIARIMLSPNNSKKGK